MNDSLRLLPEGFFMFAGSAERSALFFWFRFIILVEKQKGVCAVAKQNDQPLELYAPVSALRGVSTVRAGLFAKLGVHTLYDLLTFFPRDYEDRTRFLDIAQLQPDEPACFEAMIVSSPRVAHIRKGLDITRVQAADATGRLTLVFFNRPYLADSLHYGESYRFYGTLNADGSAQVTNPVFEPTERAGTVTGRLFPIYSLTAGLSNKVVIQCVQQALDACCELLPELLPQSVCAEYGLCDAQSAYRAVHTPQSLEALNAARRRLVFEEFFVFSAGLQLVRSERRVQHAVVIVPDALPEFYAALPYRLTAAQEKVLGQITQDLASGTPMNRLVQGDVGSGKTAVAAAVAFLAARSGVQTALMAPTEILAEQHYKTLTALLAPLGVTVALLTGSMTAAQKREVKARLADGAVQVAVGTHALITADVEFTALGLVIADEQHRFGVAQRARLSGKGESPHLLVMSATPIPRTLALIAYGELDVSTIDELPPGRQPVETFLVDENYRKRLNAFVQKQCDEGGQVYIVCPAVEESELESLKSAEVWAQTLQAAVFPQLRVGLLHGKMKAGDKEDVMARFARHEIDVLVCTTVIEVGVDVPNANLILIENADRFGLSQLHQLRGRVGRGARKSYCVLVSSTKNPDTLERLKTLCRSSDGFAIAQKDLALRGPGDFFGSRQHGLPLLRAAALDMDLQTLEQAQQAAAQALGAPGWQTVAEYAPLLRRIGVLFETAPVALN